MSTAEFASRGIGESPWSRNILGHMVGEFGATDALLRTRNERPCRRDAERSYYFPPSESDRHMALPCEGWLVKATISRRKRAVFTLRGARQSRRCASHAYKCRIKVRPGGPTCGTKPDPVRRRGIDD